MTLLISLVVLGLLFLLLEILVIPGTTVAGIIGSVLLLLLSGRLMNSLAAKRGLYSWALLSWFLW